MSEQLEIQSDAASELDPEDLKEIKRIFEQLLAGWNRGDSEAFAGSFLKDADFVDANGNYMNGRSAIASRHQDVFDGIFRGTWLELTVTNLRYLTTDVDSVLAHTTGVVLYSGEPKETVEPNVRGSSVFVKTNGEWKITTFHNTPTVRFLELRIFCRMLVSRVQSMW